MSGSSSWQSHHPASDSGVGPALLSPPYHDINDPEEEAAHAEFRQIVLQVEHDKQHPVTLVNMFRKPSWRRRTLTAIFLLFATQCTGILGIGNFQVLLYQSLGLKALIVLCS